MMEQLRILTRNEIGYLKLSDLLEYYKKCIIAEHEGSKDLETVIEDIEMEIYDRL